MTGDPVLAVFVPAAIGAGLVASLALVVTDAVGQLRSTRQQQRSVAILAAGTSEVTRGTTTARASRIGVRSRLVTGIVGVVLGALGVYGAIGSYWNYWNPPHPFHGIAWIWAASWLVSFTFVGAGIATLVVARRGRPLRGPARTLVVETRLGVAPVQGAPPAGAPGRGRAEELLGEE